MQAKEFQSLALLGNGSQVLLTLNRLFSVSDTDIQDLVQCRAAKMFKEQKNTTCEKKLRELGFVRLEKRRMRGKHMQKIHLSAVIHSPYPD